MRLWNKNNDKKNMWEFKDLFWADLGETHGACV